MRGRKQPFLKRFFTSRLFLIVAFVIVVLIAIDYARAYYQDYRIKQEIKALEEEVHSLEKKKIESMQILDYVTSPAFVEEKARLELNMKKPDEKSIIVKSEDVNQEQTEEKQLQETAHIGNPLKWWYYFAHKSISNLEK